MEKTALSNEMLSILFEKAPDVIFLYDQNGNFIDGNEEAEKLTGYKRDELRGRSFLNIDLLVPEDIPRAAKNLRRSLKNERTGPAEYKINRKDGATAHIEIRTYPFTLDGQKIVMGIARDITQRKQIEQKLEKTQMDYKKLIDKASDSVVVARKGKVLYANDAIAKLVGFDHAKEVIGLSLNSFYHPDYNNQLNEYTQARQRGEYAPSRYQIKIVNRTGESIDVDIQVTIVEWEGDLASLTILRDITDQKQAEHELMKSEKKYRSFMEASRDAVTVNSDGKFAYVNPSFIELIGYQEQELINLSIFDVIAPEYVDLVKDRTRRRQEGETVLAQYELELIRKDGTRVPIEFNISLIDYEGKPASLTFIRDISARKQSELEVEKTERRTQKLIELSSDAIIIKNDIEVLYSNDAAAQLFGFDHADELIGQTLDDYYHPDFVDQIRRYTEARRQGEHAPQRYEMKIIRQTGEVRDIEIRVTLIDWQGSTVSLGIMRDITDQKQFESRREAVYQLAALLSQATSIQEITEKALDIINLIMDYEIVSFQTLTDDYLWVQGARGYEFNEKPIHINDRSVAAKAARLKTTLNIPDVSKEPAYREASTITKSELTVPVILGDVVYGVFNVESRQLNAFTREDEIIIELLAQHIASALERVQRVTEKEAYERELFEGQIRLEQEKDLSQLKTRFMSTATHEIRTPLASIQGYTEIIQDDMSNLTEKQLQYFKVILRNVHRLSVLTDDLLDLQRLEEGKLTIDIEQVNLNELLLDVMNEFTPILIDKNQTIQCSCLDASLNIDRLRVTQVIVNLLSNASKFSPEGSHIQIDATENEDAVLIQVSDTGVGISQEDIPKLFKPFPGILVKGNVSGTGLGLNISKGIVDLHGGEIWAESEGIGKGTTFAFSLPKGN